MNIDKSITTLTTIWISWIASHKKANDRTASKQERQKAGEKCFALLKERIAIIHELNKEFEEMINANNR